jgi:hypothetical protein
MRSRESGEVSERALIQADVHYSDDDDRIAVSLALAALKSETGNWSTLVAGSADHISLIAALSDLAATLADDLATAQGTSGVVFLREALLNLGSR